jgi:hypothetical protein
MKINNTKARRSTSLRVQTGVRAGMMRQVFGRIWSGIVSVVGTSGDGGYERPNAVAGVRG